MSSLKDYRACIIANNVQAHTIRKKVLSVKWQQVRDRNPGIAPVLESFHRDDGSYSLSRAEIFACDDAFEKIVKTIWWGYPNGMMFHFNEVAQSFRVMAEILQPCRNRQLNKTNFIELYNSLNQIQHIGPSTISKLLYFFNISQGQTQCVIVDSRVRSAMAAFDDFRRVNNNDLALEYLEQTRQICAVDIDGATPEQIEYFLFSANPQVLD